MLIKYPQNQFKRYKRNYKKVESCKLLTKFNYDFSIKLVAQSSGSITYNQMIAIKTKLNKFLKKNALLKFNLFPLFPITKKPNETRMGKGVGSIDNYIYIVRTGYTLCEIYTNSSIDISKILKLVKQRLNLKTKIIRLV
jgi:large subunit ribosomal protein L16